ncbi:MAG: hypothetical protein K2K97_10935 [Muribaculaceae bacterium]|nr:hypothetical protein [Muribaculaceae bacterium]
MGKQNGPLEFRKPLKHRTTRRADFKDYTEPGFFMITMTAGVGIPRFCEIGGTVSAPVITDTPLGALVRSKILTMPVHTTQLRIEGHVLMPDHIHFLVHVREKINRHLGKIIGGMMGGSTSMARRQGLISEEQSIFKEKYHDRVVNRNGQIDRLKHYMADNPRRLLIKRLCPDLFKRYLHIEFEGKEYAAYGNIFLLKYDDILPVRIHRRWSDAEFEAYIAECHKRIRNGAVLIGPYIHKAEKAIRRIAVEEGVGIIQLRDIGFEDRFKPQGEEFELCASGKLLLIAPWPDNTGRKSRAGSLEFHAMNDMALEISLLPAETRARILSSLRR